VGNRTHHLDADGPLDASHPSTTKGFMCTTHRDRLLVMLHTASPSAVAMKLQHQRPCPEASPLFLFFAESPHLSGFSHGVIPPGMQGGERIMSTIRQACHPDSAPSPSRDDGRRERLVLPSMDITAYNALMLRGTQDPDMLATWLVCRWHTTPHCNSLEQPTAELTSDQPAGAAKRASQHIKQH
jgi:hypothetical protein